MSSGSSAEVAAASKKAKIWKRTWIGAAMVASVFALFFGLHLANDARPLYVLGFALLCAAAFEIESMGIYANRGYGFATGVAGLGTLAFAAMSGKGAPLEALFELVPVTLSLALLAFAGVSLLKRAGSDSRLSRAVLLVGVGALTYFLAPVWFFHPTRGALVLAALGFVFALLAIPNWRPSGATRFGELLPAIGFPLWLVVPLVGMSFVFDTYGSGGLGALILLSKIGDTAGYYTGSAIGKSHPFPNISPGKTTAGCVGSLVAGTLAGWVAWKVELLPQFEHGTIGALLGGAAINIAAQASDLCESWVKRRAGVKDSGPWFGPAGGVLDMVDSFLFSTPVALVAWHVLCL